MTPRDLERAREIVREYTTDSWPSHGVLVDAIAAALADERELCANVARDAAVNHNASAVQEEDEGDPVGDVGPETFANFAFMAEQIEKAIRARGGA
jgi:hypothetical protein